MRTCIILAALLCTSACGGGVVYKDRPVRVNVPVAQACAGERPAAVTPLREKTPEWDSLDVRQKAAHVGRQGLELRGYGEQLNAATAGCP